MRGGGDRGGRGGGRGVHTRRAWRDQTKETDMLQAASVTGEAEAVVVVLREVAGVHRAAEVHHEEGAAERVLRAVSESLS